MEIDADQMCMCENYVTFLVADITKRQSHSGVIGSIISKKIIFGIVYRWRDTKMWGDANHVSLAKQKIFDD